MILRLVCCTIAFTILLGSQAPVLSANGWQEIYDSRTGVKLKLPAAVARSKKVTEYGLNWRSHRGRLNIDTLKLPINQAWETTLNNLRSVPGRKIDSEAHTSGGVIMEGRDRDGTRFIVRIEHRSSDARGISIVYSQRGKPKLDTLARRIYRTFRAFPDELLQTVGQAASYGMSPRQNPLFGRFSEPFRFNPPNAEAICRREHRLLLNSAREVSVRFPEARKFANGQTVEISWRSKPIRPTRRTLHLVIDVPASAEILSDGLQVEEWKTDYDPKTQFGYQPADSSKKRIVIWMGRDIQNPGHYPASGLVRLRFTKAQTTSFGWQVLGTNSYSFSRGEAKCHPTILTAYANTLFNVTPQDLRYSPAKTCHFQGGDGQRIAPIVNVVPSASRAKVGEAVTFRWKVASTIDTNCKTPLYLVFTTPKRVRFEGEGFFALAPNAPGPFDLKYHGDQTRVFVPLHIGSANASGLMSAKIFEVGQHNINWSVVEVPQWVPLPLMVEDYDGANPISDSANGQSYTLVVEPGSPQIVVQDRYSTGLPNKTIYSNNGDFEMQVFDSFYRVIDLRTGELIVQRPGLRPDFSVGSRYVFATLKENTIAEVYDLFASRVVHVLDVEKEGRDGTHINALAWGSNDSFVIVGGDSGVAKFLNIIIDRKAVAVALGSYKARSANATVQVNLEALCLWQKDPWGDDIQNSSLLEAPKETGSRFRSTYGLIPIRAPHFVRNIYRWDLGADTRFAYAYDPNPQSLNDFKSAWQAVSAEQVEEHRKYLSDNEQMGLLAVSHLLDRPTVRLAEATQSNHSIRRSYLADKSSAVSSGNNAIALIEYLLGANFVSNTEWYSKAGAMFGSERNRQVRTEEPVDSMLERTLKEHVESSGYRRGIKKYQDANSYLENEQPKDWKQVNERFACEYDVPRELIGKFVVPNRIMARTGWKTSGLAVWLIQQDCWGGNGWRAVQLGVLIKKSVQPPEFYSFSEPPDAESLSAVHLGINSGKVARGWLTKDGLLLVAMPGRMIVVFDTQSGKRLAILENIDGTEVASSLHISTDRKRLLQINEDGKIALYRVGDGHKLLSGYYLDDELVLYNEDGYYLATPEGASFVYFKFDGLKGYHSFHQFSRLLDKPDLIRKIAAGRMEGLERPMVPPPPSIEISDVVWQAEDRISLKLAATSWSNLQKINIFFDGRLAGELSASGRAADLKADFGLLPETRWLTAVAIDDSGAQSIPQTIALSDGTKNVSARGTLYAVGVGTNKFNHPLLDDLKFAGNDAKNFVSHVAAYSGNYYANVSTQSPVLDAPDLLSAIRVNLEPIVKKAKSSDTIMLLVAGHGLQDAAGNFFLASADTDPNDPAATGGVSWETLADLLKPTKARIIIFLDACHSGAAGSSATNDDAVDALLARNAGQSIAVISASKGRQYSSGQPEFEGGLFTTYVNRVGFDSKLRGEIDTNKNGVIEMSEFYLAVKNRVSDYSKGEQTPWIARNQMVGEVPLF